MKSHGYESQRRGSLRSIASQTCRISEHARVVGFPEPEIITEDHHGVDTASIPFVDRPAVGEMSSRLHKRDVVIIDHLSDLVIDFHDDNEFTLRGWIENEVSLHFSDSPSGPISIEILFGLIGLTGVAKLVSAWAEAN